MFPQEHLVYKVKASAAVVAESRHKMYIEKPPS